MLLQVARDKCGDNNFLVLPKVFFFFFSSSARQLLLWNFWKISFYVKRSFKTSGCSNIPHNLAVN